MKFRSDYKQHNAALKYLRQVAESIVEARGLSLNHVVELILPEHEIEIAAIIKGKGMSWEFDLTKRVEWHWHEMVAQLNEESMAYVVNGPEGRSGGLTECLLARRPNSYDHKRHNQLKHEARPQRDVRLRVWDFRLVRADGTSIRLHPQWSTPVVDICKGAGHEEDVAPPHSGLGESDGPGTFRYYREVGIEKKVRFDKQKRPPP